MKPRDIPRDKEGQRLEFKGRDALDDPSGIARVVVAMLNADGGEVWIGVEEREGRAFAPQEIPEPGLAERSLRDYLVDTIEPSPRQDEVAVAAERVAGGATLLRVRVSPGEGRRPYAHIKDGGRHYVVRVADRLRPMSREEILGPARSATPRDESAEVRRDFLREREEQQRRGKEIFWVRIQPVPGVELNLEDETLRACLNDPTATGNRPAGWVFANAYGESVLEPHKNRRVLGDEDARRTEVRRDGGLVFAAPMDNLKWMGYEREIWPFALLEFPTSLFRLAATLYSGKLTSRHAAVLADLALFRVGGWKLRPYSPDAAGRLWSNAAVFRDEDLFYPDPLLFRGDEVLEEPDRCAFRLVERVYKAFFRDRYDPKMIPREYDRKSGRLVLPE